MCIALKKIMFRNRVFSLTLVLLLILAIIPIGAFANIGDGYDDPDEIVEQIGGGENGEDGDYVAGNEQGGNTGEKQDGDVDNEQGGDNGDGDDDIIVDEIEDEIEEEIPEVSEPCWQTLEAIVYAGEGLYYLSEANERIKLTGCFPEDAYAIAFPVELSLDLGAVVAAYDIAVYDAEGELFEPESAVTVELELENMPELEEDSLIVVRVPNGGEPRALDTELFVTANGYEFVTDYLSVLAVVNTIDQGAEDEDEITNETEDDNDDEIIIDLINEDDEVEEIEEVEDIEEIEEIDEDDDEDEIEEVIEEEIVVENEVEEEPIIEEPVVIELFEQTLTAHILESRGEQRSSADYQQPPQNANGVIITVSGKFPQGAYVIAYPVEMEIETGEGEDDIIVIAAYDITIYNENGEEIQPDETAIVRIILPELEDIDEVSIYHIAEDGAEPELVAVDVSVEGDEVRFEAESFSAYVVTILGDTSNITGARSVAVTVEKIWVGDGDGTRTRPSSIDVALEAGTTSKTATLSDGNNWADTWTGLDDFEYSVYEVISPDNYTATYDEMPISSTVTEWMHYTSNSTPDFEIDLDNFVVIYDNGSKTASYYIWTPLDLSSTQKESVLTWLKNQNLQGNPSKDSDFEFIFGYKTHTLNGTNLVVTTDGWINFINQKWSHVYLGKYIARQVFTITNTFRGYEVTIEKVGEDGETLLQGAEFKLYRQVGDDYVVVTDDNGSEVIYSTNIVGTITISGLLAGKYKLEETKAPTDYQELNDVDGKEIYFEIDDKGNVNLVTKNDTEGSSYEYVVWTPEASGINLGTLTVKNKKEEAYIELPETGGNGLLGFTMFGFTAIFGGASGLLVIQKAYRKKRRAFHKINRAGSGD